MGIGDDYEALNKSKRRELVNKYPLFVSWYCAVRLELTLKTLAVPIFGASNYVAVFERPPTGGMVHLHYILWKHGAPRFDLRAEQLVENARRLRKGGLVAAAQVQTVKIDDVMEFFAGYVSEWNPNKDDAGEDKEDHVAEKVNRERVRHTAATSVEDMLRLLAEDRQGERRERYMRMVRLEHMRDIHHPDPLGLQILRSHARGSSKARATCGSAATATRRTWCANLATSPLLRTRSGPTCGGATCLETSGS